MKSATHTHSQLSPRLPQHRSRAVSKSASFSRERAVGCFADEQEWSSSGSKQIPSGVRTKATASISAPSCPWPREMTQTAAGPVLDRRKSGSQSWVWSFWQGAEQGQLPDEIEGVANFVDGPGCEVQLEDDNGWLSVWRYQGLKF